jgi:AcrR family transcriptional regulator
MKEPVTRTRKQQIIATAADLFREKGYKATSMRDIASKVGLEAASMYSHIRSKEALLTDICMECAQWFTQGMEDITASRQSEDCKLRDLISLHVSIAFDHPASITVFNDEWRHLPEPQHALFIKARKAYEAGFRNILDAGRQAGTFSFVHTEIVFNIIMKCMGWSYLALGKYNKEDITHEITTFILKALKHTNVDVS